MSESTLAIGGDDLAGVAMDGVAIIDGGEIVRANAALADVHGAETAEELTGRAWEQLYTPVGPERTTAEVLETVRVDDAWRGPALASRRDGDDVPVELSLCSTDDCLVCLVSERHATDSPAASPRAARGPSGGMRFDTPGIPPACSTRRIRRSSDKFPDLTTVTAQTLTREQIDGLMAAFEVKETGVGVGVPGGERRVHRSPLPRTGVSGPRGNP